MVQTNIFIHFPCTFTNKWPVYAPEIHNFIFLISPQYIYIQEQDIQSNYCYKAIQPDCKYIYSISFHIRMCHKHQQKCSAWFPYEWQSKCRVRLCEACKGNLDAHIQWANRRCAFHLSICVPYRLKFRNYLPSMDCIQMQSYLHNNMNNNRIRLGNSMQCMTMMSTTEFVFLFLSLPWRTFKRICQSVSSQSKKS